MSNSLSRRGLLAVAGGTALAAVPAVEAGATGNNNWLHRRSVRVAHAFYRALQAKDIEAFAKLWTADAVYRVPVTATGEPGQMIGREVIVAGLDGFFALFGEVQFEWEVEPLADPSRAMAIWSLDIELVASGTYRNSGVAIFQLRGDRISDFSEYFDTAAFLRVFGPA